MNPKYLLGQQIYVLARNISEMPDKEMYSSQNETKILFSNKGNKGKGVICQAQVNIPYRSTCMVTDANPINILMKSLPDDFELHTGKLKGERLIGECQECINKGVTACTGSHQIQRRIISSKFVTLCYQDRQFLYNRPWTSKKSSIILSEEPNPNQEYIDSLSKEKKKYVTEKNWYSLKIVNEKLKKLGMNIKN